MFHFFHQCSLAAAQQQIEAACQYLSCAARTRGCSTSLTVIPPAQYRITDGNGTITEHTLPVGTAWGVHGVVKGPPSRPRTLVTTPVVGAEQAEGGWRLHWDASGAYPPATLYLHAGEASRAVTLPRSAQSVVQQYVLEDDVWRRL